MLIIILMVIIGILLYKKRVNFTEKNSKINKEKNKDNPLETLKKRFVKGELSKSEYKEILEELKK